MMKKILPAPLVSFGLFVVWLLLNRSLSPGHLLLALLLALGLPVLRQASLVRVIEARV